MDQDEAAAIRELMAMTDTELNLVQYDIAKWVCSGKRCCRMTHVRDYGIAPVYFHAKMITTTPDNVVNGTKTPSKKWHDLTESFFMCAKHFKIWKRLIKNYPEHLVNIKLFDFEKERIFKK